LSGQGWWQAAILRLPLSVPALLAVMADRVGEEADDGEVVADQARSGRLGRGRKKRKKKKKRKSAKEMGKSGK
jgi:hypothetical protein